MKKLRVLFFVYALLFTNASFAQPSFSGFLTARDIMRNDNSSQINLLNQRNSNVTVFGLYVRQYAYVTPGQNCDQATIIFSGNLAAGAVVTPTPINAGKSVAIGSNYLYNMILGAIYYENIIIPSSPPGCALPGCTWGSDTYGYNWCIYLGALAPISNSSGYSANVPPAADAASGSGYDYNLISNYIYLGPISCSDQTLSCRVANQQTQSFS